LEAQLVQRKAFEFLCPANDVEWKDEYAMGCRVLLAKGQSYIARKVCRHPRVIKGTKKTTNDHVAGKRLAAHGTAERAYSSFHSTSSAGYKPHEDTGEKTTSYEKIILASDDRACSHIIDISYCSTVYFC